MPTDISDLLRRLREDGVELFTNGFSLRYVLPEEPPSDPDLIHAKIASRREDILTYLESTRHAGQSMYRAPNTYPMREGILVAREAAGGGLVLVEIEVPDALAATYQCAGQYVALSAGASSSFFVLAGPTSSDRWQLVLRPRGPASIAIIEQEIGRALQVSAALGAGFPVEDAMAQPLIIAVAGSGIAAARPLMFARIASGDAARTHMYLGVRTRADVPLQADLRAWGDEGVTITACLSREECPETDSDAPQVRFFHGYVQDAIRQDAMLVRGRLLFVVGPPAMVEAVRELAESCGLGEHEIRINH